jgi:hypothetical protein
MSLKAELSVKLDTGGLVTTLLGKVVSVQGELDGHAMPGTEGDAGEAARLSASVDLSGIGSAVLQAAGQVSPALSRLADAAGALEPLNRLMEPLEELARADLEARFRQLGEELGAELDDARREGFTGILLQISELFGASPQAALLRDLAAVFTRVAGVDLPADAFRPPDFASALAAAVRVLGGMMSLETVLAETERLAAVMRQQFGAATVESRSAAIPAALASIELSPGALLSLEADLAGLRDLVAQGMGFGEATLVYLDFERAGSDLAVAAGMVRETDLAPLEGLLASLAGKVAPLLALDLSGVPARGLNEVIEEIEARTADLARRISEYDAAAISAPLTEALRTATDIPRRLTAAITEVTVTVRGALETLGGAVRALPLDAVGHAIRMALQPVVELLRFLTELLQALKEALEAAVAAVRATLGKAEDALDEFKDAVDTLFQGALAFIEGLNLDAVVGQIADGVKAFADLIARAQLKPYFDTATGAIDTATGVVENVPFSLIPDSMEQEVVDALRPIKAADLDAFENEIKSLLQIGPDGRFQVRPDIEAAVKTVRDKYDGLMAELARLDPHLAVARVDDGLADLIAKIREISPQVELAPVQQALDQLRTAVDGFDLSAILRPLGDAFGEILAAVDRYAPGELIQPVEERVDELRGQIIDATRLRDIAGYLDQVRQQAEDLVNRLDPVQLQPVVRESLEEGLSLLDRFPDMKPGAALGNLVAAMLAGTGLRVGPLSFEVVLDWLGGASGAGALAARTAAIADGIRETAEQVSRFDPQAFASSLAAPYSALRSRIEALPAGPARTEMTAIFRRLDPAMLLGPLAANRARYLAALDGAAAVAETLRRTGYSEVDIASARLRLSLSPFDPSGAMVRSLAESVGLSGLDASLTEVARRLFAVATPERITGLVMPLFTALRDRAMVLVDSVLAPLRSSVEDLIELLEAVDLTPLREAVDGVYQDVRAEIEALSPETLLAEVLGAFRDVQDQVARFDPLADVQAALNDLRDTTTRVLGKLKGSDLLATPLAAYDEIVAQLGRLDIESLLAPVLDQTDAIALQVDEGLTGTVDAFQRLRDALPDRVGSTELSVSVTVS